MSSTDAYPTHIGIGETARRLGVSIDTIRRWTAAGKIECIRTLGGQRRYRLADVEALLRGAPADAHGGAA